MISGVVHTGMCTCNFVYSLFPLFQRRELAVEVAPGKMPYIKGNLKLSFQFNTGIKSTWCSVLERHSSILHPCKKARATAYMATGRGVRWNHVGVDFFPFVLFFILFKDRLFIPRGH